ncbi:MAG: DUF4093 domain-containing protein [Clostridia bacterium]|nr:DUF4093 domain-containing protein [Clostridia bacterium]
MKEKIKISLPIIVEGKYDKATLSGFVDGVIITTGGFGIFNNEALRSLIRKIGKDGVIVLCDSDGGGKQIRSYLSGLLPKDKLHNLYVPRIEGKEKRKRTPSRSGVIGVEGMSREVLERLLLPFSSDRTPRERGRLVTKADMLADRLTGTPSASQRRAALAAVCELPEDMTPTAFLEAMNILYGYEEYKRLVSELDASCKE